MNNMNNMQGNGNFGKALGEAIRHAATPRVQFRGPASYVATTASGAQYVVNTKAGTYERVSGGQREQPRRYASYPEARIGEPLVIKDINGGEAKSTPLVRIELLTQ